MRVEKRVLPQKFSRREYAAAGRRRRRDRMPIARLFLSTRARRHAHELFFGCRLSSHDTRHHQRPPVRRHSYAMTPYAHTHIAKSLSARRLAAYFSCQLWLISYTRYGQVRLVELAEADMSFSQVAYTELPFLIAPVALFPVLPAIRH